MKSKDKKDLANTEAYNPPQPWWQKTDLEPSAKLVQAKKYAGELKNLIKENNLAVQIAKKEYVLCEGWTALGGLLGVFANTDYCSRRDDKESITYDARVFLQTTDGRIIATAESVCSSNEKNWKNRDEYAIKSMAQTRATAKACRLAFSWIMVLAGYEPTPAEEMDHSSQDDNDAPKLATDKQVKFILEIQKSHLLHLFEHFLIQKKLNDGISKKDAGGCIEWWIGKDDEPGVRKQREDLEKQGKEALDEHMVEVENTLKSKYPDEYKAFLATLKK